MKDFFAVLTLITPEICLIAVQLYKYKKLLFFVVSSILCLTAVKTSFDNIKRLRQLFMTATIVLELQDIANSCQLPKE